ncbi:MAG: hypothetical protein ACOZAN_00480 [Patescibacteria group bacterium]
MNKAVIFSLGVAVGLIGATVLSLLFRALNPPDVRYYPQNNGQIGTDPTSPTGNNIATCGIEQCHGVDVTCGSNVPEACTLEFRIDDTCRSLIRCQQTGTRCELVKDDAFANCQNCVEKCMQLSDADQSLNCATKCIGPDIPELSN